MSNKIDPEIWVSYLNEMNGKVTIHSGNDSVDIPLSELMDIIQKYESVMDELYEYGCDVRTSNLVANNTFDLFDTLAEILRPE